MKNFLLSLSVLLLIFNSSIVNAQTSSSGITEKLMQVGKNTYLVVRGSRLTGVYNQADSLRLLDCNYDFRPYVTVFNKGRICEIIYNTLYHKLKHLEVPEKVNFMPPVVSFRLYFTMSGDLKDIIVSYNTKLENCISLRDIDKICTMIKASRVRMIPDNYWRKTKFANITWVDVDYNISPIFFKKIHEKLKEPNFSWDDMWRYLK